MATPDGTDEPQLAVMPIAGLGNRLRVVSSFRLLARYSGRSFRLCWAPGDGWSDEDLSELFENDFPRVKEREFEELRSRSLRIDEAAPLVGLPGLRQRRRWAEGSRFEQVFDVASVPIVTYRGQSRCDLLLEPGQREEVLPGFLDDYRSELRSWRPVAAIRGVIDGIAASFTPATIGVHVRRGDAWSLTRLAPEYKLSSDRAFVLRMDRALDEAPDTTFFLATDSPETEQRFRQRYGRAILVNEEKRFVPSALGASKDNQRDAVIDLFTLARTSMLLGSNASSFSSVAAMIGGIRLETIVVKRSRLRRRVEFALHAVRRGRHYIRPSTR